MRSVFQTQYNPDLRLTPIYSGSSSIWSDSQNENRFCDCDRLSLVSSNSIYGEGHRQSKGFKSTTIMEAKSRFLGKIISQKKQFEKKVLGNKDSEFCYESKLREKYNAECQSDIEPEGVKSLIDSNISLPQSDYEKLRTRMGSCWRTTTDLVKPSQQLGIGLWGPRYVYDLTNFLAKGVPKQKAFGLRQTFVSSADLKIFAKDSAKNSKAKPNKTSNLVD